MRQSLPCGNLGATLWVVGCSMLPANSEQSAPSQVATLVAGQALGTPSVTNSVPIVETPCGPANAVPCVVESSQPCQPATPATTATCAPPCTSPPGPTPTGTCPMYTNPPPYPTVNPTVPTQAYPTAATTQTYPTVSPPYQPPSSPSYASPAAPYSCPPSAPAPLIPGPHVPWPPAPTPPASSNLAGCITVVLTDNSMLFATVQEPKTWKLTTDYGEISVSPDKISGIELIENGARAKFSMTNGDTLSGKWSVGKVRLKAAWGEAALEAKQIRVLGKSVVAPSGNVSPSAHSARGPAADPADLPASLSADVPASASADVPASRPLRGTRPHARADVRAITGRARRRECPPLFHPHRVPRPRRPVRRRRLRFLRKASSSG